MRRLTWRLVLWCRRFPLLRIGGTTTEDWCGRWDFCQEPTSTRWCRPKWPLTHWCRSFWLMVRNSLSLKQTGHWRPLPTPSPRKLDGTPFGWLQKCVKISSTTWRGVLPGTCSSIPAGIRFTTGCCAKARMSRLLFGNLSTPEELVRPAECVPLAFFYVK